MIRIQCNEEDGGERYLLASLLHFAVLPKRTKENYAVVVGSLKDTTYYNWCIEPQIKTVFVLADVFLHSNPPNGFIFIMNMKGVGIMHLTRLKIGAIRRFLSFVQEALPTQIRYVHILNATYIFEKILAIAKPFIKKELFDLILVHPPDTNMEDFFEKHIPASCMPADFGGDSTNLDQLSEEFQNQCRKLKIYLEECEKQVELYKK
ncbi:hypothetical protein JTB14_021314 [Gonioctena quinquepunctata]|nr:hypothetical protein JTB14_021314 [Gonioctena quinquepunctata]